MHYINFIQWIPLRSYNDTQFVAVALFVVTPVQLRGTRSDFRESVITDTTEGSTLTIIDGYMLIKVTK